MAAGSVSPGSVWVRIPSDTDAPIDVARRAYSSPDHGIRWSRDTPVGTAPGAPGLAVSNTLGGTFGKSISPTERNPKNRNHFNPGLDDGLGARVIQALSTDAFGEALFGAGNFINFGNRSPSAVGYYYRWRGWLDTTTGTTAFESFVCGFGTISAAIFENFGSFHQYTIGFVVRDRAQNELRAYMRQEAVGETPLVTVDTQLGLAMGDTVRVLELLIVPGLTEWYIDGTLAHSETVIMPAAGSDFPVAVAKSVGASVRQDASAASVDCPWWEQGFTIFDLVPSAAP